MQAFPPLPDPVQMMEALNLNALPDTPQNDNNNKNIINKENKPKIISNKKVKINFSLLRKQLEEEEAVCTRKRTYPMRPLSTLKRII